MSRKLESIPFLSEEGETIPFYVLEQTMIGGVRYLLVEEADDADGTVYIMKEEEGRESEDLQSEDQISCVFVEDEEELDSVMKVFEQLMDETDLVRDF